MENHMNKNRGFSLIELLIAVTLLSIIMIMVVQFMSSTSWAITKTKKNQNIQTEAMEVGSQFSDSLMQATYIRVRTMNNEIYELNTDREDNKKKRESILSETLAVQRDFVIDNYPNYLSDDTNRQIILNQIEEIPPATNPQLYTLMSADGTIYPLNDDEDTTAVMSFRKLTSNRVMDSAAKSLYVQPQYIYIQYRNKDQAGETDYYAIYYFTDDNKIYMARGALSELANAGADGFGAAVNPHKDSAVARVNTNATNGVGLLTENLSDCYFSADTEANTVFLDMLFENEKFEGYTYNYVDSVVLRNTNVLTVPPQQMYKKMKN